MYINRFGQELPSDSTLVTAAAGSSPASGTPVSNTPMPSGMPVQSATYIIPTQAPFSRFMLSRPGQPYVINLKSQDVEKSIYKDLPTTVPSSESVALTAQGADPTKVVQLQTGLEVPAYILKREAERRKIAEIEAASYASLPPPQFYSVGLYALRFPAKASIIALLAGLIAGKLLKK